MYKADFAELKSELHMLEKNDFAILKGENDRLEAELDKVRAQMREEMNRLQGSVRLDMNLEKGRLRDDLLVQESKIKDTENRIDTEISNVRTMLETLKFDIIKYIVGTCPARIRHRELGGNEERGQGTGWNRGTRTGNWAGPRNEDRDLGGIEERDGETGTGVSGTLTLHFGPVRY